MINETGCEPYTFIYTITSPGDFAGGGGIFPVGTNAVCWYGTEPVEYFLFTEYDWVTQENIVDEKYIVMYEPEGENDFPFGGIHHNLDNDKMWENTPEDVPEFDYTEKEVVIEYLKEIGEITLTDKDISELLINGNMEEICNTITDAESALKFIILSGIKEGDNEYIETAFERKTLWPDKIIKLACLILDGDYDEMGTVYTQTDHDYRFLYVKEDNSYILYDILRFVNDNFASEGITFNSIEELGEYACSIRGKCTYSITQWQ